MERRSWVIWTSPRWPREVFFTHRLELPTMLRQRCGETNLTIWRVTFGHSVVSCTRALRLGLRSVPMIWPVCTVRFFVAPIPAYPTISARIWPKLARLWFKSRPHCAQHVTRSWLCLLSKEWPSSSYLTTFMMMIRTHQFRMSCSARLECQRTCYTWLTGCQSLHTIRMQPGYIIEAWMTRQSVAHFRILPKRINNNKADYPLFLARTTRICSRKGSKALPREILRR